MILIADVNSKFPISRELGWKFQVFAAKESRACGAS